MLGNGCNKVFFLAESPMTQLPHDKKLRLILILFKWG